MKKFKKAINPSTGTVNTTTGGLQRDPRDTPEDSATTDFNAIDLNPVDSRDDEGDDNDAGQERRQGQPQGPRQGEDPSRQRQGQVQPRKRGRHG